MIFERRILVTSKKLSRLTSCVHAASALLYPMYWYVCLNETEYISHQFAAKDIEFFNITYIEIELLVLLFEIRFTIFHCRQHLYIPVLPAHLLDYVR